MIRTLCRSGQPSLLSSSNITLSPRGGGVPPQMKSSQVGSGTIDCTASPVLGSVVTVHAASAATAIHGECLDITDLHPLIVAAPGQALPPEIRFRAPCHGSRAPSSGRASAADRPPGAASG